MEAIRYSEGFGSPGPQRLLIEVLVRYCLPGHGHLSCVSPYLSDLREEGNF